MLFRSTFAKTVNEQLSTASWIDLSTLKEKQITFSPLALKGLKNYDVTQTGVYRLEINEEGCTTYRSVTNTPLVISGRIKQYGTQNEQVEISYYIDKQWHQLAFVRSELFSTRTIIRLADVGINISSLNAKDLVGFLAELEHYNKNHLPILYTVSHLGWHNNSFIPYGTSKLILSPQVDLKEISEGFITKCTLKEQLDYVYSIINNNPFARLNVMASCASPFLKDLGQRIMCVYLWGQSGTGKTAALQLALSIWGDPRKLMKNFNATACGIEETCNILKHLPLGLNERQQRQNDRFAQQSLESLVYMLDRKSVV